MHHTITMGASFTPHFKVRRPFLTREAEQMGWSTAIPYWVMERFAGELRLQTNDKMALCEFIGAMDGVFDNCGFGCSLPLSLEPGCRDAIRLWHESKQ